MILFTKEHLPITDIAASEWVLDKKPTIKIASVGLSLNAENVLSTSQAFARVFTHLSKIQMENFLLMANK